MWASTRTLILLCMLAGCDSGVSTASEPPNRIDETGLIEFYLPPGWADLPSSQKSRFVPEGADSENAMLGVIPSAEHRPPDIDSFWQNTVAKHEMQKQKLVSEASSNLNGFEVREAIYESERNGQVAIYHDYFLFSDTLKIELNLNGTKAAHERFAQDLITLAQSVRELAKPVDQTPD